MSLDHRVRMAAFQFLEEQTQVRGEVLPRDPALRPNREFVAERFAMFRKAG